MPSEACPDPEKLRLFVRSNVSEQEAQTISEHLEHCPTCDETVVGLERDSDTLARRIRAAKAQPSFAEEPECRQMLDSVVDRALAAESSADEPFATGLFS